MIHTDIVVVAPPVPDMRVAKRVALTNDLNNNAEINPNDEVTYTITLTSTGEKPLTNVTFADDVPTGVTPAGITVTAINTSKGTAPAPSNHIRINDIGSLAVNETVTITIVDTVNGTGMVSNQANVNSTELGDILSDGDSDTDNGAQPTTFPVVNNTLLIAPVGKKVVISSGLPELEWTVMWINPNTDSMLIRVTDVMPENSKYVDGSLQCQPQGSSTQTYCRFDDATQHIIFEGMIGADEGAFDAQTAVNEIVFTFRVTVTDIMKEVRNQAQAQWDSNNNSSFDDEHSVVFTDDPSTHQPTDPTVSVWIPESIRPEKINTLSTWAWLLLMILIGGLGIKRRL